jgi:hypothetical protein
MATKAKYGWTTPQQMQTEKDRVKYAGGDKMANPSQIAALKETAALNNRNIRAAQLASAKPTQPVTMVAAKPTAKPTAKPLGNTNFLQKLSDYQQKAAKPPRGLLKPTVFQSKMLQNSQIKKVNAAGKAAAKTTMMSKGGFAASKMGAVKTASPSRDGIASKGKTKGTNLGNSGKNVGIMRGARRSK